MTKHTQNCHTKSIAVPEEKGKKWEKMRVKIVNSEYQPLQFTCLWNTWNTSVWVHGVPWCAKIQTILISMVPILETPWVFHTHLNLVTSCIIPLMHGSSTEWSTTWILYSWHAAWSTAAINVHIGHCFCHHLGLSEHLLCFSKKLSKLIICRIQAINKAGRVIWPVCSIGYMKKNRFQKY